MAVHNYKNFSVKSSKKTYIIDNMLKVIEKILTRFKKTVCSHEFRLSDMKQTGIPELEKPPNNDYFAWNKYYSELYDHDSITKRISLPCCKCGEMFYAQCGLDIICKGKVIST